MYRLPVIKPGLMTATARSMKEGDWLLNKLEELNNYDNHMATLIAEMTKRHGEITGACALLIYRLLESQLEANEMDKDH